MSKKVQEKEMVVLDYLDGYAEVLPCPKCQNEPKLAFLCDDMDAPISREIKVDGLMVCSHCGLSASLGSVSVLQLFIGDLNGAAVIAWNKRVSGLPVTSMRSVTAIALTGF